MGRVLLGDASCVALVDIPAEDMGPYSRIMTTCRELAKKPGAYGSDIIMALCPADKRLVMDALSAVPTSANLQYWVDHLKRAILEEKKAERSMAAVNALRSGADPEAEVRGLISDISKLDTAYAFQAVPTLAASAWEVLRDIETPGPSVGMTTGYRAIDDMIVSLLPGDLFVVAARPSMGKTALAIGMMVRQAQAGIRTAYFSLEQGGRSVAARVLADISQSPTKMALRNPASMLREDRDALLSHAAKLLDISGMICLFEQPAQSLAEIAASAKAAVRAGAKAIYVDYLQLMRVSRKEREDTEIGANAEGLKALGKSLGVPVICLSQLNRQCEIAGRKPKLSDLRGSGGIEQVADFVVMLYCPEAEERRTGEKLAILAKGRDAGVGAGRMFFRAETVSFHDIEGGYGNGL